MALDYEAILKDSTTYPDALELSIGDQKVALGTLRDLTKKQQSAVTERLEMLERERGEVRKTAEMAADLLGKVQTSPTNVLPTERQAESPNDFDTDPWWEPVRKRLSPMEKKLQDAIDRVEAQGKAVEKAAAIWARDRFDHEYSGVKDRLKGDKYKQWRDGGADALAEYATRNQLLDRYGLPSVTKAVEHLTREDEMDRIRREARDEGMKEGLTKGRLSSMQRPTSASGGKGAAPRALDPSKNFEDLGDAVMDDPQLTEMLSNLGALGPEDLLQ